MSREEIESRNNLVLENQNLIEAIAKSFYSKHHGFRRFHDRDDAVQEAFKVSIQAAKNWLKKPSDVPWKAYLIASIFRHLRFISRQAGNIRLPAYCLKPREMKKRSSSFQRDVHNAIHILHPESSERIWNPQYNNLPNPNEREMDNLLEEAINQLSEDQKRLIESRFSLANRESSPPTLQELANRENLTRQAIHVREKKALSRLKEYINGHTKYPSMSYL
jgi:RNA polymerase sigma factor (sigma-70 family)